MSVSITLNVVTEAHLKTNDRRKCICINCLKGFFNAKTHRCVSTIPKFSWIKRTGFSRIISKNCLQVAESLQYDLSLFTIGIDIPTTALTKFMIYVPILSEENSKEICRTFKREEIVCFLKFTLDNLLIIIETLHITNSTTVELSLQYRARNKDPSLRDKYVKYLSTKISRKVDGELVDLETIVNPGFWDPWISNGDN